MRESALIKQILDHVKKLRLGGVKIKAMKIHGSMYQESGTPDVHVTYKGRSYWIEAKVGKNKPTMIQLLRIKEWQEAGAVAGVVYSIEEFVELLTNAPP